MKKLMNNILIENKKTVFDIKKMKEVEVIESVIELKTLLGLVTYIIKTEGFFSDGLSRDRLVDICLNIERYFEDNNNDFSELDIEIGNDIYKEIIELIEEEI